MVILGLIWAGLLFIITCLVYFFITRKFIKTTTTENFYLKKYFWITYILIVFAVLIINLLIKIIRIKIQL